MVHHFNVEIAKLYGIEEAILIENLYYWISKNGANEKHEHNGRYWSYNSRAAFAKQFPYMTADKIRRHLEKLCNGNDEKGIKPILIKENFNEKEFDRTNWYAFSDCGIEMLKELKYDISSLLPNRFGENAQGVGESTQPIPNNKQANNKQEEIDKDKSLSTKKDEQLWKTNFDEYLKLIEEAKLRLLKDVETSQYMERYYPNIDYFRTIYKAIEGYWGKEEAWKHCKKTRKGESTNFFAALKKSIDKRGAIVYRHSYSQSNQTAYQPTAPQPISGDEAVVPMLDGTTVNNTKGVRFYRSEKFGKLVYLPIEADPRPSGRHEWLDKNGWVEMTY